MNEMKFVCSVCSPKTTTIINIKEEDENAVCPVCKSQFKITTRFLALAKVHNIDSFRTRYELLTVEDENGRQRPRVFEAQPGMRLKPQTWITMVRFRGRLVGIADQTQNSWNPLSFIPSRYPEIDSGGKFLLGVCLLIAGYYSYLIALKYQHFVSHGSWLAFIIVCLFVLAPAILWVVKTGFGETPQKKRVLPKFKSDLDF